MVASGHLVHPAATALMRDARRHAARGRFDEMRRICRKVVDLCPEVASVWLDIGVLLLNAGCCAFARECFERVRFLDASDRRASINLANLAREIGDHQQARLLYTELVSALPDHPVIRRNALTSLEYDPDASDPDRFLSAEAWGRWAVEQAGGPYPRPACRSLDDGPLRLGYVSADCCHHTVGLFLEPVLGAHDAGRVQVFVYSTGSVRDATTRAIESSSQFRDVADLNDPDLASLIRADGIDVLVDLSGHTAGSRLTVFAHRPAPVQVSWLGYLSSIGLG